MPASSEGRVAETRVRVRYAETDQMGVVYHANYLVWMEVGRVEFIRQLGLSYKRMEREHGVAIAVVDVQCRYRAPARYDDEVIVRTRMTGVRGSVVRFGYTLHRAATDDAPEQLLAEGATAHVVVGRAMQRAALPAEYAELFRRAHVPVESSGSTN